MMLSHYMANRKDFRTMCFTFSLTGDVTRNEFIPEITAVGNEKNDKPGLLYTVRESCGHSPWLSLPPRETGFHIFSSSDSVLG